MLIGNRVEFAVLVFAVARIGAIWVPLNTREQRPGLQAALEDSAAYALIFDPAFADRLPARGALPALRHLLALDDPEGYERLRGHPATRVHPAAEDDVAAIMFTSGTTGRAKGAMLTHLSLVHSAMHYRICMALDRRDKSALCVPFAHITGVVAILLSMVSAAGTTILTEEFKAAAFLDLAARQRMTHTVMVPAMYNLCLLDPNFAAHDLSAWRIGGFGGAQMPLVTIARLAAALPALRLMNLYGATETASPTTIMPPHDIAGRGDSVGLVVPCGEVIVVDDEGRPVGAGQPGELWIRGPMVVPGYWNNEAATAREFSDGYWHSGDIGSIDETGFVRVFDRKKDVINRGGHKIYAAEVENVLLGFEELAEAAVVAKTCPVLGERVHAFLVLREGRALEEPPIREACAARLADYKVPESFTWLTRPLPRNANGKVLKRELRALMG
jgi:long-chain acyl-CoA synthetase